MRTTTFVVAAVAAVSMLGLAVAAKERQRSRASPHESVSGTVDGAAITVTYGRPSMRGRAIFGALVPFNRVWCPGADEATVLDSSRDLQIGSVGVPAGPHTIWMLPTANAWTLIMSKETSGYHTGYNPNRDLGRIALQKTTRAQPVEQLTFAIRNGSAGGDLVMTWETTEAVAPFIVVR